MEFSRACDLSVSTGTIYQISEVADPNSNLLPSEGSSVKILGVVCRVNPHRRTARLEMDGFSLEVCIEKEIQIMNFFLVILATFQVDTSLLAGVMLKEDALYQIIGELVASENTGSNSKRG